jgi:hypothetical protein
MHQVELSQVAYAKARQAAEARGLSVADFVSHLISEAADTDDLDHRFTPEVIAHLDRIAESADANGTLSLREVDERLESMKAEWRKKAAS